MKLVPAAIAITTATAAADPIRLRGDALATTAAPAGLVTLEAQGSTGPNLSAEAVVWTGGGAVPGSDDAIGDVLVVAVRGKTLDGRLAGTVGRFVETLGAIRPLHIDGGAARVRLPFELDLEAFGGVPVVPHLMTSRTFDWATGGRVARRLGDWGSVGVAYMQQRDDGRVDTEEVGVDAGMALGRRDDVGAKLAYDLANPGVAETTITASDKRGSLRTELYASYRASSHLLPATSLFSVLGDIPSEHAGTTVTWKAAPRLDVTGDLGVRYADSDVAPAIVARARLRLDDKGISALTGEIRRDGVGTDAWTGARGAARIGLPYRLAASTELELVVPDHDKGTGRVWPWALGALSWDCGSWSAAFAVEASATAEDRRRVDALVNLGRRWGTP
jgi:hypothetical protein